MNAERSTTVSPVTSIVAHEFSEFRSAASDFYVPLRLTVDHPERFAGRIRASSLDEIHVSEITARSHTVERTPELIARGSRSYYKLSLQLAGSGLLIQDRREAMLRPGDIAVYDTERPYTMVFDDDFRMMVVMFPQTLLNLPPEAIGQLTAVRFAEGEGIGGMIAPFLARMVENLDVLSGATGARLALNAVDLVSTMFASELGVAATPTTHDVLMLRVRSYIEEHLGESDLGPSEIAAAHFISTRHLHGIFRERDTTVSTWIRTRRLERARRDLIDPMLMGYSIGAIAARSGFVDAAHFSRLFKSTFGESPSELRGRFAHH
ncbi:helix-turn-helix domain-containing protein [Microbacterium sp. VKM Ac-2870]|uniref:AraC-like ligand-binding domain-containing protein n=1 Tax=Microbacterium sp. VKM Ac-2870 TaxID=2783825 RepID=UPI002B26700E|nr:helix-turn-helix domain-containing protein [Microbacterium sp. VKM Ac-2870]